MSNEHGLYAQMQLRMNPGFRDYIHTAVMHVATMIQSEPESTPYHDARVAMADKIIQTNEQVVDDFVDRVVFRAIMYPAIRDTVIRNGRMALEFADEDEVVNGILAIWNETTLAVWPTVMDDIAEGE